MRAWTCRSWGEPENLTLDEVPVPACPPDGVGLRVEAWGVNFADLVLIAGHYQARPAFPFVPGMEVAGVIEEVGANAGAFALGDRVAAYVEYSGYAERVVAPASNVAPLPDAVPWVEAAAFPVPYATAALALDRANQSADETVLVGGAGGAVGSACVELAKLRKATVIACAGDESKRDIARACGADHVVSSQSATLKADIQGLAPSGIDVALDPVGGAFFEAAFRTLGYGGRLVSLGFASGEIPSAAVNHILVRHLSVIGSSLGLTCHRDPGTVAKLWPGLTAQLAGGTIRPRVSRIMPFDRLPQALRLLADRKLGGRIVLTP